MAPLVVQNTDVYASEAFDAQSISSKSKQSSKEGDVQIEWEKVKKRQQGNLADRAEVETRWKELGRRQQWEVLKHLVPGYKDPKNKRQKRKAEWV